MTKLYAFVGLMYRLLVWSSCATKKLLQKIITRPKGRKKSYTNKGVHTKLGDIKIVITAEIL